MLVRSSAGEDETFAAQYSAYNDGPDDEREHAVESNPTKTSWECYTSSLQRRAVLYAFGRGNEFDPFN